MLMMSAVGSKVIKLMCAAAMLSRPTLHHFILILIPLIQSNKAGHHDAKDLWGKLVILGCNDAVREKSNLYKPQHNGTTSNSPQAAIEARYQCINTSLYRREDEKIIVDVYSKGVDKEGGLNSVKKKKNMGCRSSFILGHVLQNGFMAIIEPLRKLEPRYIDLLSWLIKVLRTWL